MGCFESGHRARYTGRAPAKETVASRIPVGADVHIAACLTRSRFAEIEEVRRAVRLANQHEAAAAQIARDGMRDGERKAHGDSGIDGISALLQNCKTDIGGNGFLRDHHAVLCPHRFGRTHRQGKNSGEQAHESCPDLAPLHYASQSNK